MTVRRVFIGYDSRQIISYSVLHSSIITKACVVPVSICPISSLTTGVKRKGLTPFTWARFLVPWLCDYSGWALFLDADMLALDDIDNLFKLADDKYAVMVVKNQRKFEWASLMLFNCGHPDNRKLTPEFIETAENVHSCGWTENVGSLPSEWNHLSEYDKPRPDAKIVHFTRGIPLFPETRNSEYALDWLAAAEVAMSALSWRELMGQSVHARPVYERLAGAPANCPVCGETISKIEHAKKEGGVDRRAIYACGHIAVNGVIFNGGNNGDLSGVEKPHL